MDKNKGKVDKIIDSIDANNNGRVTKQELRTHLNKQIQDEDKVVKTEKVKVEHVILMCPRTGNQHAVLLSELDSFYLIMNADETWRI